MNAFHEVINLEDRPVTQGILDSINLIVTGLRHLELWTDSLQEQWDTDNEELRALIRGEVDDIEEFELLGWWENRANNLGLYTNTEDGCFHVTTEWPFGLADYLTETSGYQFSGLTEKFVYRQAVEHAISSLAAYPIVFDDVDAVRTKAEWDDIFSN